jgi:hypothetical protein
VGGISGSDYGDPALLRKPLNPFPLDHRMNLIPEASGPAPNYWCTWNLQEYVANESHGKANIRNILSEDFLLGDDGWAKKMFPLVRGDLYLLLDDGWDIPKIPDGGPDVQKLYMRDYLSSFMLDPSKWSRFQGDPAERLRALNDAVKKEGWKGIGLWVAAQEARRFKGKAANVKYWKVDWGMKCIFGIFRKHLTRLGHQIDPDLLVEHAPVWGAFNDKDRSGRVPPGFLKRSRAFLEFSDVYRLYDVCFDLGTASMLDRLAGVLLQLAKNRKPGKSRQILHVEDEIYIAATMGCTMGIMRHPLRGIHTKMQECVRAVRWHRIAPPFGLDKTPVAISEKILFDTWHFAPGSFWDRSVIDKTIRQGAPAMVTRGLPLPILQDAASVSDDEIPFVLGSLNPNGAVSIASIGRTHAGRGYHAPLAKIHVKIPAWRDPIGIFGEFGQLVLEFPFGPRESQIWMQDLGNDEAENITSQVVQDQDQLVIPGEIIHRIGTRSNPENDPSGPGVILMIVKE